MRFTALIASAMLLATAEASTTKKISHALSHGYKKTANFLRVGLKASADVEPGSQMSASCSSFNGNNNGGGQC